MGTAVDITIICFEKKKSKLLFKFECQLHGTQFEKLNFIQVGTFSQGESKGTAGGDVPKLIYGEVQTLPPIQNDRGK